MTTALICIALLGILLFGLGFAVSTKRGQTETLTGTTGDPSEALHKLTRAHGNTAEYAPFFGVLFITLGSMSPPTWVLVCMGVATASRYLIALGLILSDTMQKPHPLRFVGALGTYLMGFALCVAVLLLVF